MKRIVRLFSLYMLMCLLAAGMILPVSAAEMPAVLEESFEEYDIGVEAPSTKLKDIFALAQQPGSSMKLSEDETDGSLFLEVKGLAEAYTAEKITKNYEFSVDVRDYGGGDNASGLFIRTPQTLSNFYEGDNTTSSSEGLTGIYLFPAGDKLRLIIKCWDTTQPNQTRNDTVELTVPDGKIFGNAPIRIRVADIDGEISVYLDEHLMCKVIVDLGSAYRANVHGITEKVANHVKVLDPEGKVLKECEKTLVMTKGSMFGWATRAAILHLDNVSVKVEGAAITTTASETESVAPVETTQPGTESASPDVPAPETTVDGTVTTESATETAPVTPAEPDDSLAVWIIIAVILAMIGITAGYITVKVRK